MSAILYDGEFLIIGGDAEYKTRRLVNLREINSTFSSAFFLKLQQTTLPIVTTPIIEL